MKLKIKNSDKELHITEHTGKMESIPSISTNPLRNGQCSKNNKIKGSVCEKCYSLNKFMLMYKNLSGVLDNNSNVLSEKIILTKDIPFLNYRYFRFESFGDIINRNHIANIKNICNKNKHVTFALWTKNIKLVEKFFNENKKPDNLILVYSSLFLNKQIDIENYNHCDKVFTVYSNEYIKENNVNINCQKKCNCCLKCYKTRNKTKYINEKKS